MSHNPSNVSPGFWCRRQCRPGAARIRVSAGSGSVCLMSNPCFSGRLRLAGAAALALNLRSMIILLFCLEAAAGP